MKFLFKSSAVMAVMFWVMIARPAEGAPRLAVLPAAAEYASFADLLAAALSGQEQVILLEREQIQKIWREQELAAGQSRDYVKLGRLLNADGFILLERRAADGREWLATRLVAVNTGVVVSDQMLALPLEKSTEWAADCARQLVRVLPKLSVKADEAIPVSLLNLRSSVSAQDAAILEREFTTLLRALLVREPAIFLLERERMEQLEAEKQLGMPDPEPFWSGALVIDGTINRDVVSTKSVSLHARLSRPNEAPVNLEVAGRRDALGPMVNELAEKIFAALKRGATAVPWEPAAEAEAFVREAEWAFRWKLWRQAFEAADASWALGLRNQRVAAYRIIARAWLAFSMRGPLDYETVGPYGFRPPPGPEALPMLTRALEIYDESFRQFAREINGPGLAWANVGMDASRAAARLLERYHARVEFRYGREEELLRLRALARQVNEQLTRHPTLGLVNCSWKPGSLPVFWGWKGNSSLTLGESWLEGGGVWFENAAEAIAHYRLLLEPEVYSRVEAKLLSEPPPLPAWSVASRTQGLSDWLNFAREMAASTNAQIHFAGLRLLLRDSLDPEELESVARRFNEEGSRTRMAAASNGVKAPVGEVLNQFVRRVATWGRPAVESFDGRTPEQWAGESKAANADATYFFWKRFLTQFTNQEVKSYTFSCPPIAPRPEQLSELIADFELVEREKRGKGSARMYLELLKGYTNKAVNQQELLKSYTKYSVPAPRQTFLNQPPGKAGSLLVSQCWSLAELDTLPRLDLNQLRLRNLVWHQGRLWMETSTYEVRDSGPEARFAWVAVDPGTMQADLITAPFGDRARHPFAPRNSLLLEDELFVCAGGVLWRRNAQGKWQQWVIPATGPGIPYAWGKQIAISTETSILEFNPQSAQTRILASTRRNPPVTALDRASRYGRFQDTFWPAPLAVWPDGKLRALVEDKVWTYDPARQDWTPLHTVTTNREERLELTPAGVFYRFADRNRMSRSADGMTVLGGWRPGSSVLEYYTWEPAPIPPGVAGLAGQFTPPLWSHPRTSLPQDSHAVFEGGLIWVFPAPAELTYATLSAKRDYEKKESLFTDTNLPSSLLLLDRRYLRALELQLEFTGAASEHAPAYEKARKSYGRWLEFLPTPAGLAILVGDAGILFWIPQAELNRAIAETRRSKPETERWGYAGYLRFDRDQNGWLDDQERRAMSRDAAWRKEEQAAWEAAVKTTLKQRGAQWDAHFASADKNRDGKLFAGELASAAAAHPQAFAERLRGVNVSILSAMRPYDLDQDLALDRTEFNTFMADPRLVAEVNRSVDWVTRFGLKPEQCDTNNDGLIDERERVSVNRLLRERGGSAGGKRAGYNRTK